MSSNTLDALGRAVLEAVEDRRVAAETLESELEAPRTAVDERLSQLVDNALIRAVPGEIGGQNDDPRYELTENGRRVLNATPIGAHDNRIDTPAHVERAIEGFDLRPDEAAAVRNAFSFLRYWGRATTAEVLDAAYTEAPAGYETADRWWADCVRDRFAALPDVRVDADGPVAGTETWTYDGTPIVEQGDRDGRAVDDPTDAPPASARHAIERANPGEDDRTAVRAAFAVLADRRRATTDELVAAVADRGAVDSTDEWADRLTELLAAMPGVEMETERGDGAVFVYGPSDDDDT